MQLFYILSTNSSSQRRLVMNGSQEVSPQRTLRVAPGSGNWTPLSEPHSSLKRGVR